MEEQKDVCPKCGNPLAEPTTTATGKKLQRCSTGGWDPATKSSTGCDYVKWLAVDPVELDEKCPKCSSPLIMAVTRFGKKMKRCSTNKWDPATKTSSGCDYIEWISGTSEELNEDCPQCGAKLVLYTTASGKRMKKCSTSGWDKEKRVATGCDYIQWLRPGEYEKNGEEFLPPDPNA